MARDSDQGSASKHSVLMLSVPFPPQPTAGVFRTLRFARFLGESGWRPLVVTAEPEADGRVRPDPSLERGLPPDVEVVRVRVRRPAEAIRALARRDGGELSVSESLAAAQPTSDAAPGPRKRALSALNAVVSTLLETPDPTVGWVPGAIVAARRLLERHDPDVIFSTSPPHSSHLAALALHHVTRKPLVLDFRDPWARGPAVWYRNPVTQRVAELLEPWCIEHASRVILNTPRSLDDFRRSYPLADPAKFAVVPNGFDPELLEEIDQAPRSARDVAGRRALRICHPGMVYGTRELWPVVEALARLAESGWRIDLDQVGVIAPDRQAPLERLIRKHDLGERVRLHGRVSHERTLRHMREADLFLVLQPKMDLQVPGKLFEMLVFRRPVVALCGEGATADLVRRFHLGEVADPDDPDAVGRAILAVAEAGTAEPPLWDEVLMEYDGRRLTGRLATVLGEARAAAD